MPDKHPNSEAVVNENVDSRTLTETEARALGQHGTLAYRRFVGGGYVCGDVLVDLVASMLLELARRRIDLPNCELRRFEEWSEADGDVLWWTFPIEEPPYVGSPLDSDWPRYHTHWTAIPVPGGPHD